jgi:hypothetical protein
VLEAKVLSQSKIYDLDGHRDELPALVADLRLGAAGTDLVIIRQIDIETELLPNRLELAGVPQRLLVAGAGGVYGADFESSRDEADDILF